MQLTGARVRFQIFKRGREKKKKKPSLCPRAASVPEYNLTGEFCRKHFLTGLLLRELGLALQDEQDLRHLALSTLKTLMAKHSLDARYATKVAARSRR